MAKTKRTTAKNDPQPSMLTSKRACPGRMGCSECWVQSWIDLLALLKPRLPDCDIIEPTNVWNLYLNAIRGFLPDLREAFVKHCTETHQEKLLTRADSKLEALVRTIDFMKGMEGRFGMWDPEREHTTAAYAFVLKAHTKFLPVLGMKMQASSRTDGKSGSGASARWAWTWRSAFDSLYNHQTLLLTA